MNKKKFAVIALVLLLVALMTGCRRAKPAVVSDVQTTPATTAAAGTGRTVVPVASPSPTSATTSEATPSSSPEIATSTPDSAATSAPTKAPTSTPVPTTAPTKTPTTAPTAAPTAVPTKARSGESTHVVQAGENLYRIALHYGMSYETVAAANGIVNPNLIHVGQPLTIPAEGTSPTAPTTETYVVQPGDNLFRIALKYGVTVEALAVTNNISNVSLIYPGQRLVIP